jgi:hypothetical protein
MSTRYELILEPQKGSHRAPEVRRLAIILKHLLRRHGYVCISVKSAAPPTRAMRPEGNGYAREAE